MNHIQRILRPRVDHDDEPEQDYSYVDEELIPFVKEVERFDKLLAAGKFTHFRNKEYSVEW